MYPTIHTVRRGTLWEDCPFMAFTMASGRRNVIAVFQNMPNGSCTNLQMATEENAKWGRGLTFPITSVHRLLSSTPIAALHFVRTSKAFEKHITEKSDTPGG